MKFKHLNVPDQWQHYWTKYPEGYTILEALISWVSQVDRMVDNVNDWNTFLEDFVKTFDEDLENTVATILNDWNKTGFLATLINQYTNERIDTLETRFDTAETTLANKVDKNGAEQVSMGMLSQPVKDAITGGAIPSVGKDSVNNLNYVNNSISSDKILSTKTVNNLVKQTPIEKGFWSGVLGQTRVANASNTWYRNINPIVVKAGDIVRYSHAQGSSYFIGTNDAGVVTQRNASQNNTIPAPLSIEINSDTTNLYFSVFGEYLDVAEITINEIINQDKTLEWLKLGANSVGFDEIKTVSKSVNLFDIDKAALGSVSYDLEDSTKPLFYPSTTWRAIEIPVKEFDVIRIRNAYRYAYQVLNNNNVIIQQLNIADGQVSDITFTVPKDGIILKANVFKDYFDSYMITKNNPLPKTYISGSIKKQIEWLEVTEDNLTEGLKESLSNSSGTMFTYVNKDGVLAGDSIAWNTGQVQNGETLIGYDGYINSKLSPRSLQNIAVSGRSMTDGTANGVGTVTTVLESSIDFSTVDFFICNAGTNDFKLNAPIGTIQPFGSVFDRNTYMGAYQTVIEYILSKNPKMEILIMTPTQRNNSGYTAETTNTAGHKLEDYRNAGKQLSEKYSTKLIDLYADSGINQLNVGTFTYDGLHLNNNGYNKAGELIVKSMLYNQKGLTIWT